MDTKYIEDRLLAYLDGELSIIEEADIKKKIEEEQEWEKLYVELKTIYQAIEENLEIIPNKSVKRNFLNQLEQEKISISQPKMARVRNLKGWWWQAAAAVAFLIIGIGFGSLWQKNIAQQAELRKLQDEMQQTQKMLILSMLQQPSASERIKAVSISQTEQQDQQIIEALLFTLNEDANVNVRLKAAEALGKISYFPLVVEALSKSLIQQSSPEVQIELIDILIEAQAKQAVDELQNLLSRENLLDIVKHRAAHGVEVLM